MSINFNAYGIKSNDMNIRNLEAGQKLIRIIRPRYRDEVTPVNTVEYVIKKVLKTRLVVASTLDESQELRLIVDQSSWKMADRRGGVTTTREGDSNSYSQTSFEFATEDEQELIDQIVANRVAQIEAAKIKRDAHQAVLAIKDRMHPDLESVEAAIAALQALADTLRAAQ